MAFRSSASASAATGAITATPTGVQVGDYLGGLFTVDDAAAAVSLPASWTQRANINHAAGAPDGGNTWYADKVAAGSDSFQFSSTSGSARSLVTSAWSGRDTVNPRSTAVVTTKNSSANTSPISATYNGITASLADDIAVFWFTDQDTDFMRWTSSTITNYTERQDGVAQNWVSGIGLQTRDNVSAGATGNFSATLTDNASSGQHGGYGAVVVAIKVSGGGTQSFSYTASGGLSFGGTAIELRNRVAPTSGGLSFGGSSTAKRVAARVASGGITFAGSALVAFHESIRTVVASGGLNFSGSSLVSYFSVSAGNLLSRIVHLRRFIGRR